MLLLKKLRLMYLVKTMGAMGQDTYNKDKALDVFEDALQLANADRYSSQYLYFIHGIGIDSYSFQSLDLIYGNDILVEKKVQS